MTAHSQGPWRAIAPPTADNGNPWRVVDQFNHGIAIVTCSPREGNAKLIAAAPAMESELDALRAENEALKAHVNLVDGENVVWRAENERLRAALEHIRDSTEDTVYVKAVAREALAFDKRA